MEFGIEKAKVLSVTAVHAFGQIAEESGRVSVSKLATKRFVLTGALWLGTGFDCNVTSSTFGDS